MLFCGGNDGKLTIRRAWDLQEVDGTIQFHDHGAITSMILQGGISLFSYRCSHTSVSSSLSLF